ncbi:cell division protein SepF, partial [Lactobacillus jensenii]|uniref:cell division protein SepF n=1 Tax=Lactobacillus jensenii TaxID=109790 RepID=UPI00286FF99D
MSSFFGISDSSVEDQYTSEESTASSQNEVEVPTEIADHINNKGRNNVVSIKSGSMPQSKIVLYVPRVYSDSKEVAQNLLSNKAVIINFSRMVDDSA